MTTSQQFLDQLIEATASAYQALIQGISDFHRDRNWISEKQAIAVKTSAYKARMAVPSSLVIRESLPAGQSPRASNRYMMTMRLARSPITMSPSSDQA